MDLAIVNQVSIDKVQIVTVVRKKSCDNSNNKKQAVSTETAEVAMEVMEEV